MRAVLFDFDGVLVDSEPLHFQALREALLPEGIEIGFEEYAAEYLAYDDRGAVRLAFGRHGQPYDYARVGAIAERKADLFEELIASVPFLPGAKELVRALEPEVPLAIASGALRREIERILGAGGLREAFTVIVGCDDVARTKPDPEPYLLAMRGLLARAPALRPDECLVVEDSVAGIAAGRAAGMRVLAVTNSYPAEKLGAAHRVVGSLATLGVADLRALFDG